MPHEVGDRTALVDSTRAPPPRRRGGGIAWALFAIVVIGAGLGGWILWERGHLAEAEATAARLRLDDATARAAAAEGQVMAMSADLHRPAAVPAPAPDLQALADAVYGAIDRSAGEVAVDGPRVVVTLDDPDLFRTDDAALTRRGQAVIDAFAFAVTKAGDFGLSIHGHVDDAPLPEDGQFDSAWELSSARALAVLHRLDEDGLDAHRLAAVAYGAERPAGADRAKNRRIEIVMEAIATPAAAARASSRRSR